MLRRLGEETRAILAETGNAKAVRTDWRQRVKVLRPVLSPEPANLAGIQRDHVATNVLQAFQGATVGVYRERDLLLPIILRAKEPERRSVESVVAEKAAGPLAERAVDRANWTLLFGVAGALGVAWVAIRFRGLRRRISRSA